MLKNKSNLLISAQLSESMKSNNFLTTRY